MSSALRYDLRAIAPTVSKILGVPAPSGSESDPIPEVLDTLPSADRLMVIVLDGFGWALWERLADTVPALGGLAGCHLLRITSVVPCLTYVCLSSMLTGRSPGSHSVASLDDAIRASSATEIDTVFDAVRRTGRTTLLAAHKKGVSGLPVDRFADHTVVVGSEFDAGLYVRVPEIVRAHRPTFGFVHLTDVDEAGHAWGPYSQEVRDAASEMDRRLGGFMLDLAEHGYAIVVLADHGLHEVLEGTPDSGGHLGTHDGSVDEDLTIPLMWGSRREIVALSPL